MARSTQTFRKRQREIKLREKAQRKRELRLERNEKKKSQVEGGGPVSDDSDIDYAFVAETGLEDQPDFDGNEDDQAEE